MIPEPTSAKERGNVGKGRAQAKHRQSEGITQIFHNSGKSNVILYSILYNECSSALTVVSDHCWTDSSTELLFDQRILKLIFVITKIEFIIGVEEKMIFQTALRAENTFH